TFHKGPKRRGGTSVPPTQAGLKTRLYVLCLQVFNRLLPDVKSEAAAAEETDFLDLTADADAGVLARDAAVVRDDQHLFRTVADAEDLEGHERDAERRRDDALDGHRLVVEFARVGLHLRDRATPHRRASATQC